MTPERRQRVKELFDAALEREGEARARFLSEDGPVRPPRIAVLERLKQEHGIVPGPPR